MKHLFRILLRLYPKNFRCLFSQEMLATFEHLQSETVNRGSIRRIQFMIREVAGLLVGICTEQMRFEHRRLNRLAASTCAFSLTDISNLSEVAEAEQCIRFHLSQTVDCIANHRFEGARFHAFEEDRARERLRLLHALSRAGANGGEL